MEEILIADGKGRLGVNGWLLHLFWAPGSQLGVDDAAASIEAMRGLSEGRVLPLLVEISGVTMSAAARGAYERAEAVSAVALVGSTVVDTIMAAALGRHGFCPHAYFTSRPEALEWLNRLSTEEVREPRQT